MSMPLVMPLRTCWRDCKTRSRPQPPSGVVISHAYPCARQIRRPRSATPQKKQTCEGLTVTVKMGCRWCNVMGAADTLVSCVRSSPNSTYIRAKKDKCMVWTSVPGQPTGLVQLAAKHLTKPYG